MKSRFSGAAFLAATPLIAKKSNQPAGRHLAPKAPFAPLTEIAQVVATGHLQRRAAVVATAGGLFMSSFAAANLEFAGADDAVETYTAEVDFSEVAAVEVDFADADLAGIDHVDADHAATDEADDNQPGSAADEDSHYHYPGEEYPTAADEEFFAALPGWVVEPVYLATPETVTEEGFAVVDATPAPPPPPARRAVRAAATNPPPASVAGNAVLEIAARYVGTPYVWGGSSPAGFDCSGFTSYVFGQKGISLPRTSSAQRNMGTVVARADAQPGDLVWWPGHVGIFVEGNTFIDAAGPGRTVQFRNMWNSNPTFIRL